MGVEHQNKNDALSVQMYSLENKKSNFFLTRKKMMWLDIHLLRIFKCNDNLMLC